MREGARKDGGGGKEGGEGEEGGEQEGGEGEEGGREGGRKKGTGRQRGRQATRPPLNRLTSCLRRKGQVAILEIVRSDVTQT